MTVAHRVAGTAARQGDEPEKRYIRPEAVVSHRPSYGQRSAIGPYRSAQPPGWVVQHHPSRRGNWLPPRCENCWLMRDTAEIRGAPASRMTTHWFAAGQLVSSQCPSGDQATCPSPDPESSRRTDGCGTATFSVITPPRDPPRTTARV